MNIEFTNAVEARKVSILLHKELKKYSYNADLHKMHQNIEEMIDELSREEVVVRQTRKDGRYQKLKQDILQSMRHLEKFILFLALTE